MQNEVVIPVSIPADEDGLTGRECPNSDCSGYFKLQFGTGLKPKENEELPCHCPYCGHTAGHDHFWTQEQIRYIRSVGLNYVSNELFKNLKKVEFDSRPRGGVGIGLRLKVKGRPHPLYYYREKQLETVVTCDLCTLRYAIYGKFAWCPDCGKHNSPQILAKNLQLVEKELILAAEIADLELSEHLIGDALENVVSAFDGFGREICRMHASAASNPSKAQNVSFQNLKGAQRQIQNLFGIDLAASMSQTEWAFTSRCFQKRHVVAHKLGIVDAEYLRATNDSHAIVGRKIALTTDEVRDIVDLIRKLGDYFTQHLP
jgi:hypothetical protein